MRRWDGGLVWHVRDDDAIAHAGRECTSSAPVASARVHEPQQGLVVESGLTSGYGAASLMALRG